MEAQNDPFRVREMLAVEVVSSRRAKIEQGETPFVNWRADSNERACHVRPVQCGGESLIGLCSCLLSCMCARLLDLHHG